MTRQVLPPGTLALLLCALLAGPGCTDSSRQAHETATATFSISIDEVVAESLPVLQPRRASALKLPLGFSPADVTSIRVDVKEKDTGAPVYLDFDLLLGAGGWTGSLPFLPKGKVLTFSARAYSASNTLLFSGITDQALVTDSERVAITLAPSNDGATVYLPRIKKVILPSDFAFGQSGNISFSIEGTAGETLTYTLLPPPGGGSFYPASGSIQLAAGSIAGTFVSRYVPPVTVTTLTVFTHQVKVTNKDGHAVSTTFQTRVLPPESGSDAEGTTLSVLFNPVINHLTASRAAGTGSVRWEASVADDGPLSALSYAWSFTPKDSVDPAPTFTANTNPTTLENYSAGLQGTLRLEVTDSDGGKTTLLYALMPDQFPDDLSEQGALNTLSAGSAHTCALLNDGKVRCWGFNDHGQLGHGNKLQIGSTADRLPYTAGDVPVGDTVVQVATGGNHTCALLRSGQVRCWGLGSSGQLGYGDTASLGDDEALTSQSYVNLGVRAMRLAAGLSHTCALLSTGKVRCWGLGGNGQLGYGDTQNVGDDEGLWNVSDVQVGGTVYDLVAGAYHTCVLMAAGKVRCWGQNTYGQLGYGNTTHIGDTEHPFSAGDVNVGAPALQLSAGAHHTCALLDTGTVRCWGYNHNGQLGYGTSGAGTNLSSPGADLSLGSKALQVAAGGNHTCALLSNGAIKCWGLGVNGQLGYGNTTLLSAPPAHPVNLGDVTAHTLTAGSAHTCALLSNGKALCWGANANGQLGYGHVTPIGDTEHPYTADKVVILAPWVRTEASGGGGKMGL